MIKNYSCIPLIVCIFVKVTRCALDQPYDYTQCNWTNPEVCRKEPPRESLQWRHNERDGVSNHQPHDCLLNLSFRRRSKKTSRLRVTGLCEGNSEGPVTRKMFPFDDVIMMIEHDWRQKTEKKICISYGTYSSPPHTTNTVTQNHWWHSSLAHIFITNFSKYSWKSLCLSFYSLRKNVGLTDCTS